MAAAPQLPGSKWALMDDLRGTGEGSGTFMPHSRKGTTPASQKTIVG